MKRFAIAWSVALVLGLVQGLVPGPARAEYRWERHLFGNDIQDLAYRDGSLYWATTSGLVRLELEDMSATVHRRSERGLPSDSINVVAFDEAGNLWCGTASSAIAILRPGGRWEFVRTFDGLPSERVVSLVESAGKMWAGTSEGFARFVRSPAGDIEVDEVCTILDPCAEELPSLTLTAFLEYEEDGQDIVWYGTAAGPVRYIEEDPDPYLVATAGLGTNTAVRALARHDGALWVGTSDGAYRFDADTESWIATSLEPTPGAYDAVEFIEHEGELLCASPGRAAGARVLRWSGTGWVASFSGAFASNARPQALVHDGEGTLWCGTAGGLRRLDGTTWSSPPFTVPGTPANERVWAVGTGPDDLVVLGYRADVAAYRWRDVWHLINSTTDPDFQSDWVQKVFVDSENGVWFGHCCCLGDGCNADRVLDITAEPGARTWQRVPFKNVRAMVHDDVAQRYFVGTGEDNVAIYPPGLQLRDTSWPLDSVYVFHSRTAPATSLLDDLFGALAYDDRGRLWIGYRAGGTNGGDAVGVSIWEYGQDPLDGTGDAWTHLGPDAEDAQFLISDRVLSMAADGSRMWVGTEAGLSLFMDGIHAGSWDASTLGDPQVNGLAITDDHSAWAGTAQGVVRFRPTALGDYEVERYAFPELSTTGAGQLAADGMTVWVASDRGVSRGDPAESAPGSAGGSVSGSLYPNPFYSARHDGVRLLDVTVPVDGAVYDAAGVVVATFRDVSPGEAVWNGRLGDDQDGDLAPPGLYAVVARSGGLTFTARVAVVR